MRQVFAGDRAQVEIGRSFFQQRERDALIAQRWRWCAYRPEPQLIEAGLQLGAEDEGEGGWLRQVRSGLGFLDADRTVFQPAGEDAG